MNFEVEKEFIEVPATTLNQPTLCFDSTAVNTPNLGHWDLKNVTFVVTPKGHGKIHVLALPDASGKETT